MKYECVSIQTKATEQYFPVELFTFIIPYEVLLTFESFFRAFSQLLKLRFTAMVTSPFHLYSRSSHHFILCFIPFTG